MVSKYDAYWLSKIEEIKQAVRKAIQEGRVILDIASIKSFGRRKPESWYGFTVICGNRIVKSSDMAHVKSLQRMLAENNVLLPYEGCFKFTITRNLELIIQPVNVREDMRPRSEVNVIRLRSQPEGDFSRRPLGPRCICDYLFTDFLWRDLESIHPSTLPNRPGVYVIRVRRAGDAPVEAYKGFLKLFENLKWVEFKSYLENRLARVLNVHEACPVICIGATTGSRNPSIRSRYRDLAGRRHTALYPVLALLLAGWKLDYGFKTTSSREEAMELERRLKEEYIKVHGRLPALVKE